MLLHRITNVVLGNEDDETQTLILLAVEELNVLIAANIITLVCFLILMAFWCIRRSRNKSSQIRRDLQTLLVQPMVQQQPLLGPLNIDGCHQNERTECIIEMHKIPNM